VVAYSRGFSAVDGQVENQFVGSLVVELNLPIHLVRYNLSDLQANIYLRLKDLGKVVLVGHLANSFLLLEMDVKL
jgi:hypothetical protein